MNKTDTEKILRFYNNIDDEIKLCKESIQECEQKYNTIGPMSYDGMPKAAGKSDKVAKTAIKNAEAGTEQHIDLMAKRIKELNRLRTEVLKELTTMQTVHKVVLIGFYLKGYKWERIGEQIGYSVRQSQNHRTDALKIMSDKITRNRYLSRSKIIKNIVK